MNPPHAKPVPRLRRRRRVAVLALRLPRFMAHMVEGQAEVPIDSVARPSEVREEARPGGPNQDGAQN